MNQHLSPNSTNLENSDHIHWFRHVAPYINTHRNKTFVVMFGGEAVSHANFHDMIYDFALLHSLGIRLVLVHGSRPQIDGNLQQADITTPFYKNLRITPKTALPHVLNAVGSIRLQIEALFCMGLANSPMYGSKINVVSGNFVTARPYGVHDGVDYQFTGEVRSIDSQAIANSLSQGHIVLLGSMGYSATGEVFNLLAEEVAVQTAIALQADKLILLGKNAGVYDISQHLIREITDKQAQILLNDLTNVKQMEETANFEQLERQRFLQSAITACQKNVPRTHILSYAKKGALLEELFTHDGSGTLISQSAYDEIRPASIADIGGLLQLLEPLEQQGILVRRSKERLESEIDKFCIIERDGMVIGCGALYPLQVDVGEIFQGEIACIAIHPNYRQGNRGADLIAFLQKQAKIQHISELFVLTTRTAHWFMELGFAEVPAERLPKARFANYNHERKSKVLLKVLNQNTVKI